MRRGFPSLALQVQEVLGQDPLGGHLFCFRGRRGDLLKVIWHDSQGACLFTKRLERGRFICLWRRMARYRSHRRSCVLLAVRHRLEASSRNSTSNAGRLVVLRFEFAA
ncbi:MULTISPECIES: IS66 family insertion sequence element accessory protein TnpB [unclassified Bradyrhizobium]